MSGFFKDKVEKSYDCVDFSGIELTQVTQEGNVYKLSSVPLSVLEQDIVAEDVLNDDDQGDERFRQRIAELMTQAEQLQELSE